ncbi:hypothetical protein MBLNU230_g4122t1 [Neophaeotheca triangularis]
MGIHGIFKEIGPGQRISLAKLSAEHYITHSRPLKLAIDISIWLFQIQSGKGGSNPALRTFYYRLLRLLSLNIHPLFVFDGPNKPLFKRNKRVGGPGVRVASVPEFLAKQLLKQFGFPAHIAPGEAEAECAMLQREGVVDAVLSEDVDTLMFGSGATLRNWTPEGSTKTPTHVNLFEAAKTMETSGLDSEGMVLVALMSGGDYIPEGIPGCGPKVACDAARAGFGKELCRLGKKDKAGLKLWRERLTHQIQTNELKFFSRKNPAFRMPEDFPSQEVLGYYTRPCVSSTEKVARLRSELRWDAEIDYPALRSFTADAFDWQCLGGAKKFIRNLAPALLVRELRLRGEGGDFVPAEQQEESEQKLVGAIHGKRTHFTTDGELELRISFTPMDLVPIDLSIEEEEDDFRPAGGDDSDLESDSAALPPTSTQENDSETPVSPSKKRTFKSYHPDQPEKLWILRSFLQLGLPLLVEDWEASMKDPKEFLKAKRKAKAAGSKKPTATKGKKKGTGMQPNALMAYTTVAKATTPAVEVEGKAPTATKPGERRTAAISLSPKANGRTVDQPNPSALDDDDLEVISAFRLPATQVPKDLLNKYVPNISSSQPVPTTRPFALFATASSQAPAAAQEPDSKSIAPSAQEPATPKARRKRRSPEISSSANNTPKITSFFSPSSRRVERTETIDLITSPAPGPDQQDVFSDAGGFFRPESPSPPNIRHRFVRSPERQAQAPVSEVDILTPVARRVSSDEFGELPDSVTKRRKRVRGPLKKSKTAPALGYDNFDEDDAMTPRPPSPGIALNAMNFDKQSDATCVVDLISSSPQSLPSPRMLMGRRSVSYDGASAVQPPAKPGTTNIYLDGPPRASCDNSHQPLEPMMNLTEPGPNHDALPTPPISRNSSLPTTYDPTQPETETIDLSTCTNSAPKSDPKPLIRRSPRHNPPAPTTSTTHPQQPRAQAKKKRVNLRESLPGFFRETDLAVLEAESVDLSGDGGASSGGAAVRESAARIEALRGMRGGWRKSGVESVDLT